MIKKIKRWVSLPIIRIMWRFRNKHNSSRANTLFNINSVRVGNRTYGALNILQYNQEAELIIGSNVSLADKVYFLLGGEHDYKRLSTWPYQSFIYEQKTNWTNYKTIVEDDVWIGFGSTILSGVKIGKGSVVGARSVVAKDIPPFSVYIGNKVIKRRFSSEIIEKLEKIDFGEIVHHSGDDYEKFCTTQLTEENVDEIISVFTGLRGN